MNLPSVDCVYLRNSKGPKDDPWGTPQLTFEIRLTVKQKYVFLYIDFYCLNNFELNQLFCRARGNIKLDLLNRTDSG